MLDWEKYIAIADRFQHKARAQDREDLQHTIILRLAQVASNNGHKPFSEATMCRIASYVVADYWRSQYRLTNGLDCGSCSRAQRRKCRNDWRYPECPKATKIEYLSKPIIDDNGNITELGELIADDKAIDLDAWADARTYLLGFPKRLMEIAHKIDNGDNLTHADCQYLYKFRKREQKRLLTG
jgi:ferredoxin-like protein FixX